uniref:Cytochrome P450 CYP3-like member 2 n=1 Tax=Phallusia mammillata TaxID=59560 RepID=A0A6F9DB24_9ASCI|nr:cytochrome P450 CYP3-like member 2 [Phallusia mammillata]
MITPLDILSLETWILIGTILALLRYYIHRKWQVLKQLGIPHDPPTLLNLGNLVPAMKNFQQFFLNDVKNKKKFGKVYGTYVFLKSRITIWDTDVLQQIYIKEFSTFSDRKASSNLLNGEVMKNQLVSVSGPKWKRIRNTLTPYFSTSKLKGMYGTVEKCVELMVKQIKKTSEENDGKIDVKEVFGRMAMDSICAAAFGVDTHIQETGKDLKLIEMVKKIFDLQRTFNIWFILTIIFPWFEKVLRFFNYSVYPKGTIEYFVVLTDAIKEKSQTGSTDRVDFMRLMLQSEISEQESKQENAKGITQNEITANSITMILAGYDTTSSTILFLAYNLAAHKDVQQKLRQEIQDTVQEYGGLTYEGLNSMKYLTMCINESQRLYPAVPVNSRHCSEEIIMNGITIPKGVTIIIPMYGLAHDEEYWEEPMKFKPERMEDMNKIDPMIFQPFGGGPRNCIGMRFALIVVKLTICNVLQNFYLDFADDTPEPPLETIFRASVRPKVDVLSLKLTPIDTE